MATAPPFSQSVIIIQENEDGIQLELFHWTDVPEGTMHPPRGPLAPLLTGGVLPPDFVRNRMCSTRTEAIQKFTAYLNAKFPDTPA